jgi:hypothetical protein
MRYLRRFLGLAVGAGLLVGCQRQANPGTAKVTGSISAKDGKVGVLCGVEINSTAPPLLIPASVFARTGGQFEASLEVGAALDDMYAAVRCPGYRTLVSRMFTLRPGTEMDLGPLTVQRD